MKIKNLTDLKQIKESVIKKAKTGRQLITVCGGTGCHASGCKKVIDTFNREIKKRDIENKVEIKVTGCHGFCEKGPIVVIHPKGIFYQKVQPLRSVARGAHMKRMCSSIKVNTALFLARMD
jgi:NADH-quinone oxidoreductase subunit F